MTNHSNLNMLNIDNIQTLQYNIQMLYMHYATTNHILPKHMR